MQRCFLFGVIGLTFAVSAVLSAPARPLYEPEEPPKLPASVAIHLNGAAWFGKYNAVNRVFIFEPDGTLSYKATTANAKVFKNRGSWKLVGNQLHFEHYINPNSKLIEFHGTIKDENTIVDEATYPLLKGKKALQTLQRTTLEIKGLP
jgi:hypothetical protein